MFQVDFPDMSALERSTEILFACACCWLMLRTCVHARRRICDLTSAQETQQTRFRNILIRVYPMCVHVCSAMLFRRSYVVGIHGEPPGALSFIPLSIWISSCQYGIGVQTTRIKKDLHECVYICIYNVYTHTNTTLTNVLFSANMQ